MIIQNRLKPIYNLITCPKSPHHLLENPVTISCGHTFCRSCIRPLIENYTVKYGYPKCPAANCGASIRTGLVDINTNYTLNKLVEKIVEVSGQKKTAPVKD
jgi:hypothetical protein